MKEHLVADRWYPNFKGANRGYSNPCPPPQRVLREAVGVAEYKFICKTVNTDHVRAACLMPRHLSFTHLLNVPWSLINYREEGVLIIVSVEDRESWIDLCRASGATAWIRCHNQAQVYRWVEPELDENGLETRPPNALGITAIGVRSDFGKQKKSYDKQALLADIRLGLMTYDEMSERYNITKQAIYNVQKREGIAVVRAPRKRTTKTQSGYDLDAVIADLKANEMTYAELGKKYNMRPISVQRIARVQGIAKPRISRKEL